VKSGWTSKSLSSLLKSCEKGSVGFGFLKVGWEPTLYRNPRKYFSRTKQPDHKREVFSNSICTTARWGSHAGEHDRTDQVMAKSVPLTGRSETLLLHAGFALSISATAEERGGVGRRSKQKTAFWTAEEHMEPHSDSGNTMTALLSAFSKRARWLSGGTLSKLLQRRYFQN